MAYGDDAQNTWDKMSGEEEKPLNDQLDEQSNEDMQETMAIDTPDAPEGGFREHIGQDDAVLSGDMAGDMSTDTMPGSDPAESEPDSDRDYDTDMEEPADNAFTDRDSF